MAVEWIAGAVVAALAIGAIAWCIAGDRARGRRRCPRCWHDLSATPGLTCSECGFAARRERDLLRTRRRIGLAAGLSISLFAAAIAVRLEVSGESVWSLMPARVPIALLPHLPPRSAPMGRDSSAESLRRMLLAGVREDLLGRIARGDLSVRDISAIADACVAGHDGARPGTRPWLEAYGDVVSMWLSTGESAYASQPFRTARFAAVSPTREELAALAAEQDARRSEVQPVSTRLAALPPIVWLDPAPPIAGAPCIVWLDIRGFVADGGEVRVRLEPASDCALDPVLDDADGATGATLAGRIPDPPLRSHAGRWIRWVPSGSGASRLPVVLGRHPQASDEDRRGPASVHVDVAWRAAASEPWQRSAFSQELPRPASAAPGEGVVGDVRRAADADAAVSGDGASGSEARGVAGDALDAAVARAFEDGVVLWQLGDLPAAIRFDASATSGEDFSGVAVGLVVDLLEDGQVRRRTRIWWPGGDPQAGMRAGWEPPEEDIEALRRLASDPDAGARWTMRVRSDADLARRATSAARPSFWEGELMLPVRARARGDAAPSRRFAFVDAPHDGRATPPSDAPTGDAPANPPALIPSPP